MKRWFVVNTKPKNEERAAENLSKGGIEVIAPKLRCKRYKNNHLVYVVEQMFPGYIFAHFHPLYEFHLVKYTRGVRTVLSFGQRLVPLDDEVIDYIRSRLKDGIAIPEGRVFKEGEKVLIKDGPFKGLSGIFEKELKGRERAMILLDCIQYAARMEIDKDLLEAASPSYILTKA